MNFAVKLMCHMSRITRVTGTMEANYRQQWNFDRVQQGVFGRGPFCHHGTCIIVNI